MTMTIRCGRMLATGLLLATLAPGPILADGYEKRRRVVKSRPVASAPRATSSAPMLSAIYACPRGVQTTAIGCTAYESNRPDRPLEYRCRKPVEALEEACDAVKVSGGGAKLPTMIECPGDIRCPL